MIKLFGDQHWVAAVHQLEPLGVSARSVRRAIRSGIVERIGRGVVGIPGQWSSFLGRSMAAQLLGRSSGRLSGSTAARLSGIRAMPDTPIRYTVHECHRIVVPGWARLAVTSWIDDEPPPERADGLLLTSPHRTLFDLAAELPDGRFRRAAEDAWHLELVTPTSARAYLERVRRRGRTGVDRFERWLDDIADQRRPATTGLEQLLADLARTAGLPEPVRQHPLRLRNGRTIHLDLAWPSVRFAVEPGHSWWHGGDAAQRADQDRDRACAERGWQVVRYDETVWDRRTETEHELARLYHARRRQFRSDGEK